MPLFEKLKELGSGTRLKECIKYIHGNLEVLWLEKL